MDKKVKEILWDIIGLIENMDLDHTPYPHFDDYKLKVDKVKVGELKAKLKQITD